MTEQSNQHHRRLEPWMLSIGTVFTGELISILTSAIAQMGLIWHIIMVTQSPYATTIATLVGFLPPALLGPFAGVVVDKLPLKVVLIGADLTIAAVSIPIAVMVWNTSSLDMAIILMVLALRALGQTFHTPAFNAMTPLIAPTSMLTRLAGISQGVQATGYLIGTGLAAIIYPLWGLGAMIMMDIAGAVLACLCVAFTKFNDSRQPVGTIAASKITRAMRTIVTETVDGWQQLRKDHSLYVMVIVGVLFNLAFSPLTALFALYAIQYFQAGTTGASLTEVTWSIGMIIGSALFSITGGFKERWKSCVFSCIIFTVTIISCGLMPPTAFVLFLVLNVVMGIAMPYYNSAELALIQERVPDAYRGRVFGFYGALASWAMPFGLTVSSFFVEHIPLPVWFIGSGIATLALCILMVSLRSFRALK